MGKRVDLAGQRFGRLAVLCSTERRSSSGDVYWMCLCDCGKTSEARGKLLRNGDIKSCGCGTRDKTTFIDLAGQRFGKLTARTCKVRSVDGRKAAFWRCTCDCGGERTVKASRLRAKKHALTHCGCSPWKCPNKPDSEQRKANQRVASAMRARIGEFMKQTKRRRKWETLVGYTREQLMRHLELQFAPGMSWQNYGEWHIDHILPMSQCLRRGWPVEQAWALSNLRPLWARDNLRKNAKVEYLV